MKLPEVDQPTRDRVCREILQHGPVTASDLAETLGLTSAAVRRHLESLQAQGAVQVWDPADQSKRGRGRPARRYVLSDSGHAQMSSAYDDLASHVLHFLAEAAGPEAVAGFADERAARLAERYRPAVERAGDDPHHRVEALAEALNADGFAAGVRSSTGGGGRQLCQGHCPVQHVAAEFPQLCEAETRAFSDLLGVHVQRLATLAHGEHVCTTHVPAAPPAPASVSAPTSAPVSAPTSPSKEKRADDHRVAS